MVTFTNFIPAVEQRDVPRTTIVGLTMMDAYSVQINTLSMKVDGYQAILNGLFVNDYNGNIYSSVGKYIIGIYPKRPFLRASAKIDVNISFNDGYSLDSYDYSFYTAGYAPVPPEPIPTNPTRPCLEGFPFFPPYELGLQIAIDEGTGTEATLNWRNAAPYDEDNMVSYNIYYSTKRIEVFDGYPDFLVLNNTTTIGGMAPGDMHFFGVRAGEYDPSTFTTSGMSVAGVDMYRFPSPALVDGYVGPTSMIITSNTTDNFPDYGILKIDTELIRYSSISNVGFVVHPNGRGYEGTIIRPHYDKTRIYLYPGREDQNSVICQATPTFQKPNYALTHVLRDGYGNDGYRDGYDGYAHRDGYLLFKTQAINSITTDGTANDSIEFPRFDYCGTWRAMSPANFMQGQCRNSYFGGAQVKRDADGYRHLVKVPNVQTHIMQREELLLESTGEPFVLLRRMWTGARCLCYMNRREHPNARCQICFNTGFASGYIQFFNPRRSDRRILVRVEPTTDDLAIVDRGGFEPMYEPDGWTLPFPQIKDRDMVIRFNPDNTEAWRYEVQHVTRNRTFFVNTGAQKLKMKRLPKTDIIYQFPVIRDTSPYPESISTSVVSTPGLKAHYHEIIIPEDVNLSTFNGATLEAEGHNHIIYQGRIYAVLNHSHSLQ